MKYNNVKDIPKFIESSNYNINVAWEDLNRVLMRYKKNFNLDQNPNFQRGHIWTEEQQIAYVEFKIQNGPGSNIIQFNCPGWMNDFKKEMVLVDGLQRLTAVNAFINNEIKVFGNYFEDYENNNLILMKIDFIFSINKLKTKKEVLQWYIQINSGGTPHSEEEIKRVRELLVKEK